MVATGEREQLADRLYEQYARSFEDTHPGEYIAITETGKTVLGPTPLAVLQRANELYGPGVFVFKLGERVIGRWR